MFIGSYFEDYQGERMEIVSENRDEIISHFVDRYGAASVDRDYGHDIKGHVFSYEYFRFDRGHDGFMIVEV